jgi:DNA-binding Lrp family transcriptional regulator
MSDNAHKLDGFDRRILDILQRDANIGRSALAERVRLSESQVARRRATLEKAGLIKRYRADIEATAIGLNVAAFVHVKLHGHSRDNSRRFAERVATTPGILEAHAVTGEYDYLLKVRVSDLQGLQHLINDVLLADAGVDRVRSEIVLETLRDDQLLDLKI